MARPRFRRAQNPDVNQLQRDVVDFAEQVTSVAGGRLLVSRDLTTTSQPIAHGMRQVPSGWILVSPNADARVWQSQAADEQFLYLQASAAVTAHILVF